MTCSEIHTATGHNNETTAMVIETVMELFTPHMVTAHIQRKLHEMPADDPRRNALTRAQDEIERLYCAKEAYTDA